MRKTKYFFAVVGLALLATMGCTKKSDDTSSLTSSPLTTLPSTPSTNTLPTTPTTDVTNLSVPPSSAPTTSGNPFATSSSYKPHGKRVRHHKRKHHRRGKHKKHAKRHHKKHKRLAHRR